MSAGRVALSPAHPAPVAHPYASLRRAILDALPRSVRIASDLKGDRARERHPNRSGKPVMHPSNGMLATPQPRNCRECVEKAACVDAHVDEPGHALGEREGLESVAVL